MNRLTPLLDRVSPEVLAYTAPPFVLRDDLTRLDSARRSDMPEAVVLYCARILEVLSRESVRHLQQDPSPNVYSNLQLLEHLGRLRRAPGYWAHALRRLGNQVRHVERSVGPDEADLALLFVEGWLVWFFCHFSHGQRLTQDRGSLRLCEVAELAALMRVFENFEEDRSAVQTFAQQNTPILFRTSALPALLIEILQGQGEFDAADRLLFEGMSRFPEDRRFCQLYGLQLSRTGQLAAAVDWMERLLKRNSNDDETLGIAASVFKRLWLRDRKNVGALLRSNQTYRSGWIGSGKKNAYLGINTATTALFLGCVDESRRVAKSVEDLLIRRAESLPADLKGTAHSFNYWDQVTLAEAQLLRGASVNVQTYETAFRAHPSRTSDIAVTKLQREEIILALERTPSAFAETTREQPSRPG